MVERKGLAESGEWRVTSGQQEEQESLCRLQCPAQERRRGGDLMSELSSDPLNESGEKLTQRRSGRGGSYPGGRRAGRACRGRSRGRRRRDERACGSDDRRQRRSGRGLVFAWTFGERIASKYHIVNIPLYTSRAHFILACSNGCGKVVQQFRLTSSKFHCFCDFASTTYHKREYIQL